MPSAVSIAPGSFNMVVPQGGYDSRAGKRYAYLVLGYLLGDLADDHKKKKAFKD